MLIGEQWEGETGKRSGMGRGELARATVTCTILLGLVLLLPAFAIAATPVFKETFGSASQPNFLIPVAMTVDAANGDLLVIDTEAETISRFKADGSADNFSALPGNVIDGAGGADLTPQGSLEFGFGNPREVEIAIAPAGSAGGTAGDIYVIQNRFSAPEFHLIDIFSEAGTYLGQLTASSEGALHFSAGVAVDPAGAVYISEFNGAEGKIHKYLPAANPAVNADNTANFSRPSVGPLAAGSGPTNGSIFSDKFGSEPVKLDSSSGSQQCQISPGESLALAVNQVNGHLFSASESAVTEYKGNCAAEPEAALSSFSPPPGGNLRGIAVNGTSRLIYISREGSAKIEVWELPAPTIPEASTEAAGEVSAGEATLHGSVVPNGIALEECFFEWGETQSYGETTPCEAPDAAEIPADSNPHAVHARIAGLNPGTTYHFRLVAINASGEERGGDKALTTLGPVIANESVSQISGTGARVAAQINPQGEETTFEAEYLSQAEFEAGGNSFANATVVPSIPREAGSGTEAQEFLQQLTGLEPDTTYHFLFVATNGAATSHGENLTFTTLAATSGALPDERAYELVSPPRKAGEVFPPESFSGLGGTCRECLPGENNGMMPMQSAPDGEAVVFEGQPFGENLAAGPNEYLANRGSGGWSTQSLSEPLFGTFFGQGYEGFSADLSRGVLYQSQAALSSVAPISEEGLAFANLYMREGATLRPLVSESPPQREAGVPVQHEEQFRIFYDGANPGTAFTPPLTRVVFEANDALTEEVEGVAPAAPQIEAAKAREDCGFEGAQCNLYEWAGGQLALVNVLPGNTTAAANSVIGSGRLLSQSEFDAPSVDHAVSSDGSRIFWSSEESGQAYVRIDGEESLEIPGPGNCKRSVLAAQRACFLRASADGSRVLLSNGQIYELNEEAEAFEPTTDLGQGKVGFQGILGAGEDLSHVYFIDTAVLSGEENDNEEVAGAGKFNLYAWEGGAPSFLGRLAGKDDTLGDNFRYGDWKASSANRTAQVSPDGRYLAFMSQGPLIPGLGKIKCGGEACSEVYEYSSESEQLSCVSCNRSGQSPLGPSNLSLIRQALPRFHPFRQPGNLSANGKGRLFFESQDALVPRDTNGKVDVYEWEPNGVGSCKRAAGCVFLISSGQSANDSMFLDSTPSGDDAFFVTRQRLLPEDENEQLDIYDARVHGGFPIGGGGPAPCVGPGCEAPLTESPPRPVPGSSEVGGPGNPPVHHKKKHHRKKHHKRKSKHARGGAK
jgi:hypothetical protein